jgi:hypothetical protein
LWSGEPGFAGSGAPDIVTRFGGIGHFDKEVKE